MHTDYQWIRIEKLISETIFSRLIGATLKPETSNMG